MKDQDTAILLGLLLLGGLAFSSSSSASPDTDVDMGGSGGSSGRFTGGGASGLKPSPPPPGDGSDKRQDTGVSSDSQTVNTGGPPPPGSGGGGAVAAQTVKHYTIVGTLSFRGKQYQIIGSDPKNFTLLLSDGSVDHLARNNSEIQKVNIYGGIQTNLVSTPNMSDINARMKALETKRQIITPTQAQTLQSVENALRKSIEGRLTNKVVELERLNRTVAESIDHIAGKDTATLPGAFRDQADRRFEELMTIRDELMEMGAKIQGISTVRPKTVTDIQTAINECQILIENLGASLKREQKDIEAREGQLAMAGRSTQISNYTQNDVNLIQNIQNRTGVTIKPPYAPVGRRIVRRGPYKPGLPPLGIVGLKALDSGIDAPQWGNSSPPLSDAAQDSQLAIKYGPGAASNMRRNRSTARDPNNRPANSSLDVGIISAFASAPNSGPTAGSKIKNDSVSALMVNAGDKKPNPVKRGQSEVITALENFDSGPKKKRSRPVDYEDVEKVPTLARGGLNTALTNEPKPLSDAFTSAPKKRVRRTEGDVKGYADPEYIRAIEKDALSIKQLLSNVTVESSTPEKVMVGRRIWEMVLAHVPTKLAFKQGGDMHEIGMPGRSITPTTDTPINDFMVQNNAFYQVLTGNPGTLGATTIQQIKKSEEFQYMQNQFNSFRKAAIPLVRIGSEGNYRFPDYGVLRDWKQRRR